MELVPTTMRKKAQRRYCLTSMIQLNADKKRKHMPPLNKVQLGVQMRFTIGQTPVRWKKSPRAMRITPVMTNLRIGCRGAAA